MSMHKAAFHTSPGDILFFPQWVLHGKKETYLTCILIVILGITFQGIKFARQQCGRKCQNITCMRYILSKGHVLQTILYLLQFVWGYILMLAVMSYNVWIMIATLVGFGLGYFFFGWGEYEAQSSMLHIWWHRNKRSWGERSCGGGGDAGVSNSHTQELLPMSKSTDDILEREIGSGDGIGCHCGEKI